MENANPKKSFIRKTVILTGVIVLAVLLVFLLSSRIVTYVFNRIPLFPEEYVFYCMTPWEASLTFGPAQDLTQSVCDTPDTGYHYVCPVLGQEADVECFFTGDSHLHTVSVKWSLASAEEANALYEEVLSQIRGKHSSNDDFYEKSKPEPEGAAQTTSIGVNYGATGVSYSVSVEGCTVSVWGYYTV